MAPLQFRRGNAASDADPLREGQGVGHVYLDVHQRLLHCLNEDARQLRREGVPLTPEELAQHPLRTLAGQPVTPAKLPLLVAWREGRPDEATFVLTREGGAVRHVVWSASPLKDDSDRVAGVLGSVRCAVPEPDWQALAGLAHDLRTPLQSLKLLVAVLDQEPGLEGHLREVFERVRSSADRAMLIGMDLLEWCRGPVQGGRRSRTDWFALEPFLQDLAAEQDMAARQKALALVSRLEAARGWEMCCDRVRLGRLLANLLANAVRYTTAGRVEFSAAWQEEDGKRVLALGIVDSGTGISAEEQESIFQPFARGRAGKDSDHSGSGLGLAVVDRLVEELGLALEVYSEYGHGSAFHLLLPEATLRRAAAK
jgi:signal transduction histidine kinase